MPILPQETLEEIIDYLYDDRKALLSCSLAARNLVPVCRYHLFSEVTLVANRLCGFLELLDVPWSSVPGAISKIIITGSTSSLSIRCQMRLRRRGGVKAEPYIPRSFLKLCAQLKNVETIRLSDMTMSEKDVPETLWHLLSEMKGLKKLEVHRVTFESPSKFFKYVSSMPNLEALSISRVEVTSDAEDVPFQQDIEEGAENTDRTDTQSLEIVQSPGQVHDACARNIFRLPLLDLRQLSRASIPVEDHPVDIQFNGSTVAGPTILRWLLAQSTVPSIQALRINLDCERSLKNLLAQYFKSAGSGVERLQVGLPASIMPTTEITEAMSSFDFGSLDQVRFLHIDGLLMSHSRSIASRVLETFFRSFFDTLLTNSGSCTPSSPGRLPLEKITITLTIDEKGMYSFFGIPDFTVLQSFDWCSLPEIIEQVLEPFPETRDKLEVLLRVRSTGITGKRIADMEESLKKESAWKCFNSEGGGDRLKVVFLPILEKDEDSEGV